MDNPSQNSVDTPIDVLNARAEKLDADVVAVARKLISKTDFWKQGYKPSTIAAAAVYAAGVVCLPPYSKNQSQREVAGVFNVTEPSIRNHYQKFSDLIDEDILSDFNKNANEKEQMKIEAKFHIGFILNSFDFEKSDHDSFAENDKRRMIEIARQTVEDYLSYQGALPVKDLSDIIHFSLYVAHKLVKPDFPLHYLGGNGPVRRRQYGILTGDALDQMLEAASAHGDFNYEIDRTKHKNVIRRS